MRNLIVAFLLCSPVLICSGCGSRDTSTPAKALIGHWRFESDDTLDTGGFHMVGEGWFRPDGTFTGLLKIRETLGNGKIREKEELHERKYRVGEQDLTNRTLDWSEQKSDGTFSEPGILKFSDDFNEIFLGGDNWKYVDSELNRP